MATDTKIIYPELSYKLIGILYKIHTELGSRYQEKYYQRATEIELKKEKIKFKKEIPVNLKYCNRVIGKYFLDFLIENKIILELKTVSSFHYDDFKQVSAYLKATNLRLGILVNFRSSKLIFKRVLNSDLYLHLHREHSHCTHS